MPIAEEIDTRKKKKNDPSQVYKQMSDDEVEEENPEVDANGESKEDDNMDPKKKHKK